MRGESNMATTQQLNSAETALVIRAINEKLGENKLVCPLSHDSVWEVNSYYAAVPAVEIWQLSSPDNINSSRTFPFAVLICQTCGYSFFVNLFKLGITK